MNESVDSDAEQLSMLDIDDKWREEWKNMPEYKLTRVVPVRVIKINLKTEEDVKKFEELIGQKLYPNRENYWYPGLNESMTSDLIYVDDES